MKEKSLGSRIGKAIVACLIMLAIALASELLGELFVDPWAKSGSDAVYTFCKYLATIGTWIIVIAMGLIMPSRRGSLKRLSPRWPGNRPLTALAGLLLGLALNLIVAGIAMASGSIHLTFARFEPLWALLLLLAVLVQSGAEELLCRLFLMDELRKCFPKAPAIAVVGNGLVFTCLHLANPGISFWSCATLFLTALLLSLVVYCFDSLWAAILIHTAWNYTQNILLGLPNSGHVMPYSIFVLTGEPASGFAYDPVFGLEGSPAAAIVIAIACLVVFLLGRRKKAAQSA